MLPRKTIIEITDALAIMIDSGLSVKDALTLCQTVFPQGRPGQLVATLVARLRKGNSFSSVVEELHESFRSIGDWCALARSSARWSRS